ncbi:MAG TPA: hypothetical protein VHZ55_11695 [Bryobacteraceae bacterium]|nr:hypothetical protein [Bryobacteraceae bacterium]
MAVKTIVCLANSYKPPDGRCIAGREIVNQQWGGWIRPVSARETKEVLYQEYRYENGQSPQLLDVIDIPVLRAEPIRHQSENYVIDAGHWVKRGVIPWDQLEAIRDQPDALWINNDSTSAGTNDRISQEDAAHITNSMLLIRPDDFTIEVGTNYWTSRRSYRASFRYRGTVHNLSVTDPAVRSAFATKEIGSYALQDVYLCISLTEPYEHDDKCHKLVAAIITGRPLS